MKGKEMTSFDYFFLFLFSLSLNEEEEQGPVIWRGATKCRIYQRRN